jgi:N-methylhydantoinase A/oxoprolinase/acetone carboxylase beta subunit
MGSLSPIGEFRPSHNYNPVFTPPSSAYELQEPSSTFYSSSTRPILTSRLNTLTANVKRELRRQGFPPDRIQVERMLNMRFEGTDTSLMVLPDAKDGDGEEDFEAAFRRVYKTEFGFLLQGQSVSVDDIKVGRTKASNSAECHIYHSVTGSRDRENIRHAWRICHLRSLSLNASLCPSFPRRLDIQRIF